MNPILERQLLLTRRYFLGRAGISLGAAGLMSILAGETAATTTGQDATGELAGLPHFAPCAKRVIYLFQSGAPSQLDLFDYKPSLGERQGEDLPDSVRMGQRLTGMTSGQKRFPIAPSMFKFARHGKSGAWLSELLPHTAAVADELCFIKSLHTEAINHDPAVTFITTGATGRPAQHRSLGLLWSGE